MGSVCVCVPVPLVPRHSWLRCAVWVCVLGLGFRLRPATLRWGAGVCACSCARSARTLLLLARVCDVAVCAWARVSAAPRHSWLGCCGVCVLVCAPRLYPATPAWGVRCGCVCLGLGFGCAPPLLAVVLGCLCICVPALLVPRHSWLGGVVWARVLGLGFQLRPATPGWGVWVCVCSCARSAFTPPLLAGMCGVGVCAWARVWAAPHPSWLGCWGVCVFVCALRLYPATPGWGVRRGCVCLGFVLGCIPPLLAAVLGCVCVRVPAPLVPRHSWLGCVVRVCVWARVSAALRHSWLGCWGVCVFVCPLRLYPATPRWGVRRGCLCFGLGFGCAPPLLAGVLGCVCARVPAPLVPRHCWLRCVVWVGVLGLGFRLRPATPGWVGGPCVCSCARSACTPPLLAGLCSVGVCLGSGFGCAWPLLAGMSGCVCVRVPAPLVPCHSWLGRSAWVCVLGLRFRLRPVSPGWGVWVCVSSCARSPCSPPVLAGVCGVCVCVFGLGFRLRPATPGWGVRVCVCSCARSAYTPPLLAGVCAVGSWLGCWGVCVFVCPLRLYPATPGRGVRRGCVCLGLGFGCAPPLLAWVSGCVCVCVRAPLVRRHSWQGRAVWVCVLGLGFRLRPATPGWGVGVCVCLCSCSACTPPLLAWVCGVGVWDGCCLKPVPVSWFVACCARCPGLRHPLAVVAWHLFVCRGFGRPGASLACLVALRWCAAPRLVRSLSLLWWVSQRRGALPHPGGLRPRIYWAAARGTWRPAENRALCACRWPLLRQVLWARSASYPFGAPRWGCPWRVPPASVVGCVRCGGWRSRTRSLTHPVTRTARLATRPAAPSPSAQPVTPPPTAPTASPSPAATPAVHHPHHQQQQRHRCPFHH